MLTLTKSEQAISDTIKRLKEQSGSHSPSVFTLLAQIPSVHMAIDACFLSNPYATELFLRHLELDLIKTNRLKEILEFYPSQNRAIANLLAQSLHIDPQKIFVGNGAAEIIQAICHHFVRQKMMILLPTFSSYYEFVKPGVEVVFSPLDKQNNFALDLEQYIVRAKREKPDTIVLINPNNPTGTYLKIAEIQRIVELLPEVENIVIDESFIHFSFEDETCQLQSAAFLADRFDNVIIVKSMSKDFGIAGIRAGYALMSPEKVDRLLSNGYLWNISGLAQYFFTLYAQPGFWQEYEPVRIRYIQEAQQFFNQLTEFPTLKVYPSMANFALVELLDGSTAADFAIKMLANYGIYTRNCGDKLGLEGEFIRIAARTEPENQCMIQAIANLWPAADSSPLTSFFSSIYCDR